MHPDPVLKAPSRLLLRAAVAGPIFFTLVLAVIDVSKYAWLRDAGQGVFRNSPMSVNSHGAHGWLMIANFVIFGCLTLALALTVRQSFPASRARTCAVASIGALAAGLLLAGFRCDTELFGKKPPTTWNGDLHFLGFGLMLSSQPFIALSFWRLLRRYDAWQEWARVFAVAAAIGIPIYVLFAVTQPKWSWWYAWFGVFQLIPLQAVALRLAAPARVSQRAVRAVAVAILVLGIGLATGATAFGGTTTLRLVEHETFAHKLSDGESFGGLVYDLKRHKVGHDRITCSAGSGCHVTEWLKGGNLFGAFAHGGPHFTVRITGGTGIYAGARGSVTVAASPGSNRYTAHIVRP
ncbi:MAG TPA: DUF998 domain-containing protein [Gaiellaceae bacterium]|nr:DUF998 domain-containing protein [Gaiellaceae bacterium]